MKTGPGVIAGLALKQFFKKPATIEYPNKPLKVEPLYRGQLTYNSEDCVGCNLCMRDCPAGALTIVNVGTPEEKKFECHLNVGHCIFCAQCVDSCRKGCLGFSQNVELGVLEKEDLKVIMK